MIDARSNDLGLLLAERAITRVLNRYAQGVDRRDFEQIRDCYWADAHDSHGAFEGDRDAYVAWLIEVLPRVATSMHQYTNVLIDVDLSSGTAESEAYCLNVNVFPDGGQLDHGLRYLDTWQRRDGAWRIYRRRVLTDWSRRH
jgi:hypothetical protein